MVSHLMPDSAADVCLPFMLSGGAFRGRLVRLTAATTNILGAHKDPEPVSLLLAEAMAAAVALASGLKYKGVFTFQIQGKGPVHTLVVDVTSDGDLRGCTKFDADELTAELARSKPDGPLSRLLGLGAHLSFTVDQGPDTERYQGIVELSGETLADAIHHYFRQSEQLESAIKIVAAPPKNGPLTNGAGSWTAAALLLQRMPEAGGIPIANADDADDAWRTAVILMSSVKDTELLDLSLSPVRLLHRLFGTMDARAAPARPVAAKCRCSRERSERILASFPVDEVRSYADNGEIHMTCEFCRADYVFPESELEAIVEKHNTQPPPDKDRSS